MGYYKIIDGKRYDRELLELADSLVKGRGDGRISEKDAKELFAAAQDGGEISKTEKDTLTYITKRYNITDKAKAWLAEADELKEKDQTAEPKEEEKSEETVYDVMREVIGETMVDFYHNSKGAQEQAALPNNSVSFLEALRRALHAMLEDLSDHYSPEEAKKYLQDGNMSLQPNIPYDSSEMSWHEFYDMYNFWPSGRNPAEYWIFDLNFPYDRDNDRIYWITVPRAGAAASVSSFN